MQDFTAGQKLIWSKLKKRMDKKKTYYVSINFSSNNTIATIINRFGDTLAWTSCGSLEFTNKEKSTEVANEATGVAVFEMLKLLGILKLGVILKGDNRWQDPFLQGMLGKVKEVDVEEVNIKKEGVKKNSVKKKGGSGKNPINFTIVSVKNVSNIPHNGCSRWKSLVQKKPRRLRNKREEKKKS